jgi:hypothetical protein
MNNWLSLHNNNHLRYHNIQLISYPGYWSFFVAQKTKDATNDERQKYRI